MKPLPITTVRNIVTGDELTFSLPPNEAVVAAHESLTKKNNNTWSYDFSQATKGAFGWMCGAFLAKQTA